MAEKKDQQSKEQKGEEISKLMRELSNKILTGKEFENTRQAYAMYNVSQLGYGEKVGQILSEHAYDPWNINVPGENGKTVNLAKQQFDSSGEIGNRYLSESEMKGEVQQFMETAYQYKTFEELLDLTGNPGAKDRVKKEYQNKLVKDAVLTKDKEKELHQELKNANSDSQELAIRKKLERLQYNTQIYQQARQEVNNYSLIQTLKGVIMKNTKLQPEVRLASYRYYSDNRISWPWLN